MTNIIEVRKIEKRLEALRLYEFVEWTDKIIVAVIAFSSKVYVAFSTGQWSVIGVDSGYDGDIDMGLYGALSWQEAMLYLIHIGVATEEESETIETYYTDLREQTNKRQELEQYERLKAKYGDLK